jgi:hypothetical protein
LSLMESGPSRDCPEIFATLGDIEIYFKDLNHPGYLRTDEADKRVGDW